MVTIPVVAHPLFGTRIERVAASRPVFRGPAVPGGSPRLPYVPGPFDIPPVSTEYFWVRNIDRSHGTRRSREEISAFFTPDPGLTYTEGLTVNDVWAAAGIEFRLIDIVEHSIDSDLADMMSEDTRIYYPLTDSLARSDAVNLFLSRALVAASGRASGPYSPGGDLEAFAFLADLEGLSPTAARWQLDIVVIAHEFGHLLGLPHMPDESNLMHPWAGRGPTALTNTQLRIAEARATVFPHL